jgi:ATP-dependent helicase Lhr and Lhr-like helicase
MTSSPPSGSSPGGKASRQFTRLDPRIQRWVWEKRWTELRDIQEETIATVLDGDDDLLVAAATALGKTEAVFLPLCSLAASSRNAGLQILYVSPLKALINDQFNRLEGLCGGLDLPVHRWHGDVGQGGRRAVLDSPFGVLLITPESLEAFFVLRGPSLKKLFAGLEAVVVDEVHSFIGRERGRQLQSLLHRIEVVVKRRVRRAGLSATLGDMGLAAEFLRPGYGERVKQIVSSASGQEIRLQIRGYRDVPNLPEEPGNADALRSVQGAQEAIAEHIFGTVRGSDNLVFANSRREVEEYTDALRRLAARHRLPDVFWPHHGSLSKAIREDAEDRLKKDEGAITVVCTSTLELGIDIGSVTSVAQIGPPPSVASLRQRLGRSGRRGDPAILRIYVAEQSLQPDTPPQDQLRAGLVQAIAMTELLIEGWCEPPEVRSIHLSTLVQQLLSLLAQHGGARADQAWRVLCETGPFREVDTNLFASFLRQLGQEGILMQASDGSLLPGPEGERILNHHGFYAAFATPEEYRVLAGGRELGTLPVDFTLIEGMHLIFAGRRWRVEGIDEVHKIIEVAPATGGKPPRFGSSGSAIHDRVRERMKAIYGATSWPAFLDPVARDLLSEARENFRRLRLYESYLVEWGKDTVVFPWAADRVHATLALLLTARELSVMLDGFALTVVGTDPRRVAACLGDIADGPTAIPAELARMAPNKMREKYDHVLGDELLAMVYASSQLDPVLARETAARISQPRRSSAKP